MVYDPIRRAEACREIVVDGVERKYYRFRGGEWYGGIATADCVGCALECVFCWSGFPRDNPSRAGRFYSPQAVFDRLIEIAKRRGYRQLRVSGNEPTIAKEHLLSLLELVKRTDYRFILETSGILIGHEPEYSKALAEFDNLEVRVSLKGTNPQEFSRLTGAMPEAFDLQLRALKSLLDQGVSAHAAIMLSFSSKENAQAVVERLKEIDPNLWVEEEYVLLYPLVERRLRSAQLEPLIAFSPSGKSVQCKRTER
ncbi:MAG: radical SAM protein [Candidatus Bathyarchaeia archaeon]